MTACQWFKWVPSLFQQSVPSHLLFSHWNLGRDSGLSNSAEFKKWYIIFFFCNDEGFKFSSEAGRLRNRARKLVLWFSAEKSSWPNHFWLCFHTFVVKRNVKKCGVGWSKHQSKLNYNRLGSWLQVHTSSWILSNYLNVALVFCKRNHDWQQSFKVALNNEIKYTRQVTTPWSTFFGVRESWFTEKLFCESWLQCTPWNMNC